MSKSLRKMKQERRGKDQLQNSLREMRYKKAIDEERKRLREGPREKSLLLEVCGDDIELHYVLSRTMFVNPERFTEEKYVQQIKTGRKYKRGGDLLRARKHFRVAAAVSLYNGNPKQVRERFNGLKIVDPDSELTEIYNFFLTEKNAIKAIKTVKEFYDKSLKSLGRVL